MLLGPAPFEVGDALVPPPGDSVLQLSAASIWRPRQQSLFPESRQVAVERTAIGAVLEFSARLVGRQKIFEFGKDQEHR